MSQCDGKHELPESKMAESLSERGLIHPAEAGEAITDWQKPNVYFNRYFPALNWMITGKCNYNCRHCFNASDHLSPQAEFTWQQCLKLLDGMEECGIQSMTITGGEPMLHPRFLDVLRECAKRHIYVEELNTNGYFITSEILDEMKFLQVMPLMKISFDGIGHHDWMRNQKGAEQKTIDAIKLCIRKGFRVKVQTNVHRGNLVAMLPTAEYLEKLGVYEMRIIRTTESPRWNQNSGEGSLNFEEYYNAMLEFTSQYIVVKRSMNIDIWQFLQIWPMRMRYHYRPLIEASHYQPNNPLCSGNRAMVAVGSDGEVYPCLQMSGAYSQKGWHLGNVHAEGLQKLLSKSRYLDEVTCTVNCLREHNSNCLDCRYFKSCQGGCRAIACAMTGDYLGADPAKCLYFNNGYMEKTDNVFSKYIDWKCVDR